MAPGVGKTFEMLTVGKRRMDEGVDVVLHDERFTTVSATDRLRDAGVNARRGRSRVDGAAATVLLESWMSS